MSSAVGCRAHSVHVVVQNVQLPVWVLYPTEATAAAQTFGPYTLDVAMDAPVAGLGLPVVLISHGNNGSPWTHRGTAMHLARAGHVVVMMEHIGNSRSDGSLAGTVDILTHRPRHLREVLQFVRDHGAYDTHADFTRVGIVGHSIGAYTALAAAGGRPVTTQYDIPTGKGEPVPVETLDFIRALVLMAPAAGWFAPPGSLADVQAPTLLLRGEADMITPGFHADIVAGSWPGATPLTRVDVHGAGHFSFQSPFPPAMVNPAFPPSQDPPGFDRVSYHEQMNAQIASFCSRHL
ncbi:MAG: alpha/beta hydrolase [Gemmatimonadaceae bacterium]|nr:alpha/beta hydrolase [Gemmatimonadaceae bacterium]